MAGVMSLAALQCLAGVMGLPGVEGPNGSGGSGGSVGNKKTCVLVLPCSNCCPAVWPFRFAV